MPFDFSVVHDRRRITLLARDPLSVDDMLAILDRHAAQGWTYSVLHDASQTAWLPSAGEVVRILSYVRATSQRLGKRRGPVALIASSESLIDVTRAYARFGVGDFALKTQVFADHAKAEAWLDTVAIA
jgi:hypothetical protein